MPAEGQRRSAVATRLSPSPTVRHPAGALDPSSGAEHGRTVSGVKPLLSAARAAELLGIDLRMLRQLIDLGHLPAYGVAHEVKLRPEHLDAYRRGHLARHLQP